MQAVGSSQVHEFQPIGNVRRMKKTTYANKLKGEKYV